MKLHINEMCSKTYNKCFFAADAPSEVEVKAFFEGGTDEYEGRAVVELDGQPYTVCAENFHEEDAMAICKTMFDKVYVVLHFSFHIHIFVIMHV